MENFEDLCNSNCPGYRNDPKPGDLWPGETEEEFGYQVSENAVREEDNWRIASQI
jgi:hypothetical protein